MAEDAISMPIPQIREAAFQRAASLKAGRQGPCLLWHCLCLTPASLLNLFPGKSCLLLAMPCCLQLPRLAACSAFSMPFSQGPLRRVKCFYSSFCQVGLNRQSQQDNLKKSRGSLPPSLPSPRLIYFLYMRPRGAMSHLERLGWGCRRSPHPEAGLAAPVPVGSGPHCSPRKSLGRPITWVLPSP